MILLCIRSIFAGHSGIFVKSVLCTVWTEPTPSQVPREGEKEREKKRGRERAQKESARRERVREESEDQFPLIGCLDRLGPGYGKRTGA